MKTAMVLVLTFASGLVLTGLTCPTTQTKARASGGNSEDTDDPVPNQGPVETPNDQRYPTPQEIMQHP